jgi:hypothetical protein
MATEVKRNNRYFFYLLIWKEREVSHSKKSLYARKQIFLVSFGSFQVNSNRKMQLISLYFLFQNY